MNIQYISDQNGIHTSVVIPIDDWNRIKEKYSELEKELDQKVYQLSKEQESAIDIALDAMNNGEEISQETVMEQTRKKYPQLFKNR